MNVRAAAAGDRDALARVIASDDTFRPDEVAVALELVDLALAGSTDYELRLAVDADGAVRGYVCYGPTPMTRHTYDLYWIVVDAAARGLGVASRLVAAMEDELRARGAGHVRVETSETDGYGAARALYARLGYPEASRLDDFYAPGDALITYYTRL